VPPIPQTTAVDFGFTAGILDVTVRSGDSRALIPGEYKNLWVKKGGTLQLQSGHYVFEDVKVERESFVEFDLSAEPIIVDVVKTVDFGERASMAVTSGAGSAADILFRVAGNVVTLKKEGIYLGTYLAPGGEVRLGTDARLTGALYGRKVDIMHRAQIIGNPARDLFASLFVNPEIVCLPTPAPATTAVQKVTASSPDPAGTDFGVTATLPLTPTSFSLQDR